MADARGSREYTLRVPFHARKRSYLHDRVDLMDRAPLMLGRSPINDKYHLPLGRGDRGQSLVYTGHGTTGWAWPTTLNGISYPVAIDESELNRPLVAITRTGVNTGPFRLPAGEGANGQYLRTNGAGGTSWATVATGDTGYTWTAVSASAYTVLTSDDTIGVNSTSNAVTVTLPEISGLRKLYIIDAGGAAASNNITVAVPGGSANRILGETAYVISGNYNSITLLTDGGDGWFLI